MHVQTCRSCQAKIIWAGTQSGKRMPLDAEPNPEGNIAFNPRIGVAIALTKEEIEAGRVPPPQFRYTSHFATCPEAKTWRQP